MGITNKTAGLFGDKQLIANLAAINKAASRRIMRRAISKGARPIVKEMKADAPKESGALRRAIKSKMTRIGGIMFYVDPKVAARDSEGKLRRPSKYAHLVEHGTQTTKPRPFFRKNIRAQSDLAMKAIEAQARIEFAKETAKLRTGI